MQFIRCQIPRPMCSTHRSGMNMAPLLLSFAVSECVSPTPITSLSSFLAYTHSLPLRSIFRLLVPPRDNGGKERRGGRGILRAHLSPLLRLALRTLVFFPLVCEVEKGDGGLNAKRAAEILRRREKRDPWVGKSLRFLLQSSTASQPEGI